MKPGCFGSTIAINPHEEPCVSCPFLSECGAVSRRLEARVLKQVYDMDYRAGETGSRYNRTEHFFKNRWLRKDKNAKTSTGNTKMVRGKGQLARAEHIIKHLEAQSASADELADGLNPLRGVTGLEREARLLSALLFYAEDGGAFGRLDVVARYMRDVPTVSEEVRAEIRKDLMDRARRLINALLYLEIVVKIPNKSGGLYCLNT